VVGNGPGAPLLVVHGGPGFPHDYLEPLQVLGEERPIIFYDQLGCGNSDRSSELSLWTLERFVEELVLVREHLGLDEVHLFGHSWGSILVVNYYASLRPQGVKSMVLSSPSMSIPRSYDDMRRYLEQMPLELREAVRIGEESGDTSGPEFKRAVRAYNRRHLCRVEPPPECIKRAHSKSSREIADHFLGWRDFRITGYMQDFDCTEQLASIDVPTLFICGEHDDACPESTGYYHRLVPGSDLEIVKDASHNPQLENPSDYLGIIRSFLAKIEHPSVDGSE
jgi:proline iminopeptidase